jgi:hypothetical protein
MVTMRTGWNAKGSVVVTAPHVPLVCDASVQMLEQYVGKELKPSDLIINTGLWGESIGKLGLET